MGLIQRALVVEDEQDSQDLLIKLFKYFNIAVDATSSGEEALAQLQTFKPSVVVVDLALPGMDGWTLLKRIRNIPSLANLPIVAITAFHTAELAKEAIQVGFDGYFAKPLNVNTFVRDLEELV